MLARIIQSTADKGLFPSPLRYVSSYFNTPIAAQLMAVSTAQYNSNHASWLLLLPW